MKEYDVCWADTPDGLVECVNEWLNDDWELYGNPFFGKGKQTKKMSLTGELEIIPGECYFCQAMLREKKE